MKPIDSQVEEYLNYCKNVRRMTDQTMRSKAYILESLAKLRIVDDMIDFDNRIAHRWVQMQLDGTLSGNKVGGRTVNTRMSHVVAFCKWLRDMDYPIKLKIALIEKAEEDPPRRSWFTREQVEAVLETANEMERVLVSLLFDSGLRAFELQNLRLENINGRHMRFVGKGRKQGDAWMTDRTRGWLDDWIYGENIIDYLWPSPIYRDGRPYSTDQLRYIMARAFKRASRRAQLRGNTQLAEKLKEFYPHAMRHSFATDIQENGATLDESKELLRHTNSSTTEIYLHGLDSKMDSVYDRLKGVTSKQEALAA